MAIRVTEEEKKGPCILRLFDIFDGWFDVYSGTFEEVLQNYNHETNNGTKNTSYSDGVYWAIYPADTKMLMTPERVGR